MFNADGIKFFFRNNKKFSFSEQNIIVAGFWFFLVLCVVLLFLDGFIFYRYSYTVVNEKPSANLPEIGLDEKKLEQAGQNIAERQAMLQKLLGQ